MLCLEIKYQSIGSVMIKLFLATFIASGVGYCTSDLLDADMAAAAPTSRAAGVPSTVEEILSDEEFYNRVIIGMDEKDWSFVQSTIPIAVPELRKIFVEALDQLFVGMKGLKIDLFCQLFDIDTAKFPMIIGHVQKLSAEIPDHGKIFFIKALGMAEPSNLTDAFIRDLTTLSGNIYSDSMILALSYVEPAKLTEQFINLVVRASDGVNYYGGKASIMKLLAKVTYSAADTEAFLHIFELIIKKFARRYFGVNRVGLTARLVELAPSRLNDALVYYLEDAGDFGIDIYESLDKLLVADKK